MKKLFVSAALIMSTTIFAAPVGNIIDDQTYNIEVRTGENKAVSVPVVVKLDHRFERPVSKKYINEVSNNTFAKVKTLRLKNPYSFKPREVTVEQVSNTLEFIAKYTAENSYGSDVVGEIRAVKFLWADGNYHDKPE